VAVYINIKVGRVIEIEVSGSCDTVAGELAAAAGVIYSHLCDTGTDAGNDFRDAITSMLDDGSPIWEEARKVNTGGGASVVIVKPVRTEGQS